MYKCTDALFTQTSPTTFYRHNKPKYIQQNCSSIQQSQSSQQLKIRSKQSINEIKNDIDEKQISDGQVIQRLQLILISMRQQTNKLSKFYYYQNNQLTQQINKLSQQNQQLKEENKQLKDMVSDLSEQNIKLKRYLMQNNIKWNNVKWNQLIMSQNQGNYFKVIESVLYNQGDNNKFNRNSLNIKQNNELAKGQSNLSTNYISNFTNNSQNNKDKSEYKNKDIMIGNSELINDQQIEEKETNREQKLLAQYKLSQYKQEQIRIILPLMTKQLNINHLNLQYPDQSKFQSCLSQYKQEIMVNIQNQYVKQNQCNRQYKQNNTYYDNQLSQISNTQSLKRSIIDKFDQQQQINYQSSNQHQQTHYQHNQINSLALQSKSSNFFSNHSTINQYNQSLLISHILNNNQTLLLHQPNSNQINCIQSQVQIHPAFQNDFQNNYHIHNHQQQQHSSNQQPFLTLKTDSDIKNMNLILQAKFGTNHQSNLTNSQPKPQQITNQITKPSNHHTSLRQLNDSYFKNLLFYQKRSQQNQNDSIIQNNQNLLIKNQFNQQKTTTINTKKSLKQVQSKLKALFQPLPSNIITKRVQLPKMNEQSKNKYARQSQNIIKLSQLFKPLQTKLYSHQYKQNINQQKYKRKNLNKRIL